MRDGGAPLKYSYASKPLSHWIGAAGVDPRENDWARRAGLLFEFPMLIAAIWILMSWWSRARAPIPEYQSQDLYDIALWVLFVTETLVLTLLVDNRRRYLATNWLNLLIVGLGISVLFGHAALIAILRLLRLLILFSLLMHVGGRIHNLLSRNQLGTTLLASAIVITLSGILMASLDPAVETPLDGIWWAWVTVTTVGYGDVVPSSGAGKLFGGLIILMGVGLFAMITATVATYFISRESAGRETEEKENERRIRNIEDQLYRMEEKLDRIIRDRNQR